MQVRRSRRVKRFERAQKLTHKTPSKPEVDALDFAHRHYQRELFASFVVYCILAVFYINTLSEANRPRVIQDVAGAMAVKFPSLASFGKSSDGEVDLYLLTGYVVHAVIFAIFAVCIYQGVMTMIFRRREHANLRAARQVYGILEKITLVRDADFDMRFGNGSISSYSATIADLRGILKRESVSLSRSFAQMAGLPRRDGLEEPWTRLARLLDWSIAKPSSRLEIATSACMQALLRIHLCDRPAEPLDIEIPDTQGRSFRRWRTKFSRLPREFVLPVSVGVAIAVLVAITKSWLNL